MTFLLNRSNFNRRGYFESIA